MGWTFVVNCLNEVRIYCIILCFLYMSRIFIKKKKPRHTLHTIFQCLKVVIDRKKKKAEDGLGAHKIPEATRQGSGGRQNKHLQLRFGSLEERADKGVLERTPNSMSQRSLHTST